MKKLLTLIFLVTTAVAVNAQELSFGPRVGLNLSTLTDVDDAKMKPGLHAGLFMVYSFQEHFGVSIDALYSAEGAKYKNVSENGTQKITNEITQGLNYLRVPVQACLFFGDLGNPVRPKITLGPDIGFLLSAKTESETTITDGNSTTTTETTDKSKDGLKSIDFGAIVGAGANFNLSEAVWLNVDLRYYIGASEIAENPVGDSNVKNQNLHFSLGLAWGFGQ